jgi:hypothetical protein
MFNPDLAKATAVTRPMPEGKTHKQAVLSLAGRRLNVLWAMLRDNTPYHRPNAAAI